MASYASLAVEEGGINETLGNLVSGLLSKGAVKAVLVPARQPYGNAVMQTIITDPSEAGTVDPLAPVAPFSSATLLARLTRRETSEPLAAFLRPCEVRAFLELEKLRQASRDGVLLIGMDCHGRYGNRDFLNLVGGDPQTTGGFLRAVQEGKGTELTDGVDVIRTCRACVTPEAENVDLRLEVIGHDVNRALGLQSLTPGGDRAIESLGLPEASVPEARAAALETLLREREAFRKDLRAGMRERTKDVDGLMEVISHCINCYNCRVACPVCYCRECVFVTDTFQHESRQYLGWATKRRRLRMPTDTLFYHLTRMAHMSTLCVGCGQCTSACPMDIPVGELFSTVAEGTQAVFDYVPGRDPEEEQPLAFFVEDELPEVTGQVK